MDLAVTKLPSFGRANLASDALSLITNSTAKFAFLEMFSNAMALKKATAF
jgi:hypothetical protein